MALPQMRPWVSRHWRAASAFSVSSGTASTKPSPKRLSDMRSVRIVSRLGNALLDLERGKRGARADGAIVDEIAARDHRRPVPDGNARVDEAARGVAVSRAQLGHLAGAAGVRVLVALAAGLRVVERAEPVRDVPRRRRTPRGRLRGSPGPRDRCWRRRTRRAPPQGRCRSTPPTDRPRTSDKTRFFIGTSGEKGLDLDRRSERSLSRILRTFLTGRPPPRGPLPGRWSSRHRREFEPTA